MHYPRGGKENGGKHNEVAHSQKKQKAGGKKRKRGTVRQKSNQGKKRQMQLSAANRVAFREGKTLKTRWLFLKKAVTFLVEKKGKRNGNHSRGLKNDPGGFKRYRTLGGGKKRTQLLMFGAINGVESRGHVGK